MQPQPSKAAPAEVLLRAPAIKHLRIERFRGIRSLAWRPAEGVNVILGGGDVCKTTILEAIGFLFSPTNAVALSDADYHQRAIDGGFAIEAVVSLPPASGINLQLKPAWPWSWNGVEAVLPSTEGEGWATAQQVYRLRACGTPDLELTHEILQPDGTADILSVGLRRSIGLVRLGGDDRNDRDLRLVQGSGLDRLLSDKSLRSRVASELAKTEVKTNLTVEAGKVLQDLDLAFRKQSLPSGLDLSITGGPGASIASMIGLTATAEGVQLPLASWGAGTRRLAALVIAEQNQGEAPITLVDEVERGLEPYRQRELLRKLQEGASQVFLTTHSPSALKAAAKASLWYLDHGGNIGILERGKVDHHRRQDPDTFLSRLAIVAEGATEVGFATALLERAFGSPLDQHGIHISDGGGHERSLGLLEALGLAGLRFGGFGDNEGKHPVRWEKVAAAQGPLLFRWPSGCLEENIIGAVPTEQLEALLLDPAEERTGRRLRTLADRLGIAEKDFSAIAATAGADLGALVRDAALGTVPRGKETESKEYKAHAQVWFKSVLGGRELEGKVFSLGLWPTFRDILLPFCNAILGAATLPEVVDFAE